ncbi:MAG TPA: DUF4142 domain-containing protein [Streptosporangiaceae bacterium]|nr:DUF4142 domain-containing protein [Streptosporangiaceae bacterium]
MLSAAKSASVGAIVIDSKGHTLYRFEKDTAKPARSNCAGLCAKKWPPVLAGDELSTMGVDQSLVGRVKRQDGRWQLTLAGWPLYRYAGDRRTGDVKGHNVGGVWFAVAPDGTKAVAVGDDGAAAGGARTRWGPLGGADRDLLVKIRQAWLWELPAAQLARQRARSLQVKDAGKRLAAQRAELDEEIRSVAGGLRVALPGKPGAEQRKWLKELAAAKGRRFDELFVNRMRAAQGQTLVLAAQVRASTRNSLIREFAQRAADTTMKQMALLETTGLVEDSALAPQPAQ